MEFEYSYGTMGLFMRYLGGPILLAASGAFIFFPGMMLFIGIPANMPIGVAIFILLCIPMSFFSLKGSWYLFKYRKLFTMKFIFSENDILINENDSVIKKISGSEIKIIVYRRMLKVFEIYFNGDTQKEVVLMNNGKHETASFIKLKDHLLVDLHLKLPQDLHLNLTHPVGLIMA